MSAWSGDAFLPGSRHFILSTHGSGVPGVPLSFFINSIHQNWIIFSVVWMWCFPLRSLNELKDRSLAFVVPKLFICSSCPFFRNRFMYAKAFACSTTCSASHYNSFQIICWFFFFWLGCVWSGWHSCHWSIDDVSVPLLTWRGVCTSQWLPHQTDSPWMM